MITLGLSGAIGHDPSAALYVDGKLVAAIEEERLIRDKHARGVMPLESTRFVLRKAGVLPAKVNIVAIPLAPISLFSPARWHYAKRYWYAPDRSLLALINGNRRYHRYVKRIKNMLETIGFDWNNIKFIPVEHHLAHASSCYHLSGFKETTAIMSIDGRGEYTTTLFGIGKLGKINKIKEFYDPDSLGGLYGAITEYLGFNMLDGEYKVMGMAPYGDPDKYDLSPLIKSDGVNFQVNNKLVNVIGLRRYKENGRGFYFSPKLVQWLGPRRKGDVANDPYIHYAAAIQKLYENTVLQLMQHYLGDTLRETGKIAFAGGGAMNVKLNQKIMAQSNVKQLFVQPASGDAGTAIGAAAYASFQQGQPVESLEHIFLGPAFSNEEIIEACSQHQSKPHFKKINNVATFTANLLAKGHPVAWFQGAMEFGPRALGKRSILGCPSCHGIADLINRQIKFRERWRPFCPSVLEHTARQMFKVNHPSPFMTLTMEVTEEWKARVPEVVHEDGTARCQIVYQKTNPRFHALLESIEELTGNGVVLNTSLNRRGEPIVCTPEDALNMFFGSDLEYLIMEDILVVKHD